jgi:Ran GTPase-activating protein (RanGAP) involved in mRNA processing and transport
MSAAFEPLLTRALWSVVSDLRGKSGWLRKRRPFNRLFTRWKDRFAVLRGSTLLYYDSMEAAQLHEAEPRGALQLLDFRNLEVVNKGEEKSEDEPIMRFYPRAAPPLFRARSLDSPPPESGGAGPSTTGPTAAATAAGGGAASAGAQGDAAAGHASSPVDLKSALGAADTLAWCESIRAQLSFFQYLERCEVMRQAPCAELVLFLINETQFALSIQHSSDAVVQPALRFFLPALKARRSLRQLVLRRVGLSDASLELLCELLQASRSIESVDLQDNAISASGAFLLARTLRGHASLRDVDLSGNPLGDEGVTELARVLGHSQLRSLHLRSVSTSARGGEAVLRALTERDPQAPFPVVDLSGNALGDSISTVLGRLLERNGSVQHLLLRQTGISDAGAAILSLALRSPACNLQLLDLSSNLLSASGIAGLGASLAERRARQSLTLVVSDQRGQRILDSAELGQALAGVRGLAVTQLRLKARGHE